MSNSHRQPYMLSPGDSVMVAAGRACTAIPPLQLPVRAQQFHYQLNVSPLMAVWTPACIHLAGRRPWRLPTGFGSGSSPWVGCCRTQSRGRWIYEMALLSWTVALKWGPMWYMQQISQGNPIWWHRNSCNSSFDWCSNISCIIQDGLTAQVFSKRWMFTFAKDATYRQHIPKEAKAVRGILSVSKVVKTKSKRATIEPVEQRLVFIWYTFSFIIWYPQWEWLEQLFSKQAPQFIL